MGLGRGEGEGEVAAIDWWGEVAGWVGRLGWVVLGFWWTDWFCTGVVDWVESARSTAPTKII